MKEKIQMGYMFINLILSLGIVGNIERGIKTNKFYLVIYFITLFLTVGKLIYLRKKEV